MTKSGLDNLRTKQYTQNLLYGGIPEKLPIKTNMSWLRAGKSLEECRWSHQLYNLIKRSKMPARKKKDACIAFRADSGPFIGEYFEQIHS
jgi:hypothetical protein